MRSPSRPAWGGAGAAAIFALAVLAAPQRASSQEFPYELSLAEDLAAGGLVAGGFLLPAVYEPFDLTTGFVGLHRGQVNFIDRVAVGQFSAHARGVSDGSRDLLLLGTIALVASEAGWDGDFATLTVMTAEAALLTGLLTSRTKAWRERLRPYAYDEDMDAGLKREFAEREGDVQASFYSGHAATAFAAAMYGSTVLGDLYGWSDVTRRVRVGLLGVAATTAVTRVLGGQHYPSDVLVGAVVGSLVGWGVPRMHRPGEGGRVALLASPTSIGVRVALGGSRPVPQAPTAPVLRVIRAEEPGR